MGKTPKKTSRIGFRITDEMMELVRQAMSKTSYSNMTDFMSHVLREYLDDTANIVGSRRHFTNSMNARMDRIEALILWQSLLTQTLTARGLFTVLDELAPEDAVQEPPTPDIQLRMANEHSRQLLSRFLAEQASIVNDIAEYRRKQAKEKKK
jgi:uncharacterized protein (DUF1778 family)